MRISREQNDFLRESHDLRSRIIGWDRDGAAWAVLAGQAWMNTEQGDGWEYQGEAHKTVPTLLPEPPDETPD